MKRNKAVLEVKFKGIGLTMTMISALSGSLGVLIGIALERSGIFKAVEQEQAQ